MIPVNREEVKEKYFVPLYLKSKIVYIEKSFANNWIDGNTQYETIQGFNLFANELLK